MYKIYAINDIKGKSICPPVCASSLTMVKEDFRKLVSEDADDNIIAAFPEDFELVCLGSIDDKGIVNPRFERICTGLELKAVGE